MQQKLLLCSLALLAASLTGCSTMQGGSPLLTPAALRCEYKANPLGIDKTAPRFDWQLKSDQVDARDQKQSAYRILVASSAAILKSDHGDLWDSGEVKSDATSQIAYAGNPLKSEQHAVWKVRTWNGAQQAGKWSEPSTFSVGLLNPDDWKAKWIGYDAPAKTSDEDKFTHDILLDGLKWVWCPEANSTTRPAGVNFPAGARYFRKVVTLPPGNLSRATALISADNRFELLVNGKPAGSGTDFHLVKRINLLTFMHTGENVIGIVARNDAAGPAGLIGRLKIVVEGIPSITEDIDETWQCSSESAEGWNTVAHPAGKWSNAIMIAKLGDDPWKVPGERVLVLPPPPYLRKEFAIDKPIGRATICTSALGLYELHLNGQRVSGDYFTPGWTEYSKRVQYRTYDVTPMLKSGKNAIGAILGDGWYSGYFGFSGNREIYGKEPRFIGQLCIEYTDGSRETINTDSSWKAQYGPIREADLLMGCAYDAKQELGEWNVSGYDDSSWEPVAVTESVTPKLETSPSPTVQVSDELPAKSIHEPKPGVHIFDLGQNMVGWARLKLSTKPGQKITFRYAEMLNPDGTLYTTSLRAARATDTYTAKGGDVTWEPTFTFHGFRYVEITGVDSAPPLAAITGIVAGSKLERTGEFECSNPLVNKLVHNIIWGQKGNYFEAPTDCPQRDERLGWTGDAQFFIPTATYNFDVAAFFNKWLIDLCEDSANDAGAFASVAPNIIHGKDSFGATAWADAGIVCPYTIWRVYGDTTVIRDHYDAMTKYIEYLHTSSKNLIRPQGAYGDWLNLGGGAKSEVIGTAYFEHVTRLMSEMSAAIGKTDDAAKYRALADQVREAFIKNFITDDGKIKESSQTGYALAFAFDLLPTELRAKAADAFVEEIKKKDWHLATGFIGTPRLLPALSLSGRADVAYRLLQQESFPGWLFQVKLGATTMWERWDGWTPEKGFQDPGMNSFNHYAFGSVGEWLYRTAGGIDTDGPGYQKIIIRPEPGGDMNYVRASYDSIHGEIESSWKLQDGKLAFDVTIPINTSATIYVPTSDPESVVEAGGAKGEQIKNATVYKVGSGRYSFTAKP